MCQRPVVDVDRVRQLGNWVKSEKWLRWLVFCFIIMGGMVAMLKVTPAGEKFLFDYGTITHNRAPFWMLLAALSAGHCFTTGNCRYGGRYSWW